MHVSGGFILLFQVTLILALSRLLGAVAVKVRQPKVVGEMVAGIMLGPSVLGWLAPEWSAAIFPSDSVHLLDVLAQFGVILFLFLIGLELDVGLLRTRGRSAFVISNAGILVPFVLGAGLTWYLYPRLFASLPQGRFLPAMLFMGAAMSVTAFPVLARILSERGLQKSNVGVVAITAAAVGDVTAWCMLAFIIAIAQAQGMRPGLVTAGLTIAYVLAMVVLIRPRLQRLERFYERPGTGSQSVVAVVLLLTILSAAVTEWIGIHALFGAFLMGAIMPRGVQFVRMVTEKLEDLTVIFLLPVFFAYAGLRTQLGLLNSAGLWEMAGLIIAGACIGKLGGTALAGRLSGMGWRESSAVGILMNSRGLMELVILTIGLEMGVITDAVFAIMVLMALVTTAMTTPMLYLVYPNRLFETATVDEKTAATEFGILVPVSRPESGPGLTRMAAWLGHNGGKVKVYALNLRRHMASETLAFSDTETVDPVDPLSPLVTEARQLAVPVEPLTFPSRDVPSDIARIARAKRADLVLMGFHKPVIGNTILGGVVHRVVTGADTDVAILVDRGLVQSPKVLVPYQGSAHDQLAVELARRLAHAPGMSVTMLLVAQKGREAEQLAGLRAKLPRCIRTISVANGSPVDAVLQYSGQYDLAVLGLSEDWGLESHLFGLRAERIAEDWQGSLLLVRKHEPIAGLQTA